MKSLDPIDLKEDQEKYEAKSFSTKLEFRNCKHPELFFNENRTELRCTKCSVSWSGSRMSELARLLNAKVIVKDSLLTQDY